MKKMIFLIKQHITCRIVLNVILIQQFNLNYIVQMEISSFISLPALACILLLIAVMFISYNYFLMPYMKFTHKVNELKDKYTIYKYPFRPFGFSYIKQFITDLSNYGDSFHIRKNDFSKVDITIGLAQNHLTLNLVNENLIQEFYQRQKEGYYIKTNAGMSFKSLKQFLGNGLLLSQTDEWKYKRKIMSSIFNYELIKSKFGMMVGIVNNTIQKQKQKKNQNGKYSFDLNKLLQEIFGNVVIKCFFGNIELDKIDGKEVFEFLYDLTNKIGSRSIRLSSFLFGSILMKYGVRQIDREINRDINLFREFTLQTIFRIIDHVSKDHLGSDEQGLIAKLLREQKIVSECCYEEKIKRGVYTHIDLVNQMCTFFFAGSDTTASVISSLIHKLAEHRDVQQKLRMEIKQVLKDDINNITLESLKNMNYLRYTQSEILRIMTSVPFIIMREATQDHKIGDINIQKGTFVTAEILSRHHKEEDFENPLEFRPQRWEKLQNLPNLYRYYYPFSMGNRVCIGQQLALTQSKIAIIAFLLNFKKGKQIESPRLVFNITYGPEKSLVQFEDN